jgi:glycosyltransferase involved in cell wall biosynthesis
MKILHVIERTDHNGCATQLLQLTKFLNRNEFENTIVCLSKGILTRTLDQMNVRYIVLDRTSYSSLSIARRISSTAEQIGAELVHCHDRISANLSLLATSTLKLPFVYNVKCWSYYQDKSFPARQIGKVNERFLMNQASYNILPSPVSLKEGQREFTIPNGVVIPRGVDTHEFDPDRPNSLSRRVYGIPENYTVVGFLARLCNKKDPLTLIRAAALALNHERKLHFMIVGDGELKESCLAETRRLGIENSVSFQNIDADVPSILNIFDIYCLPSHWEGFSIGLLEAMAMKKAIITSPVKTNLEVIANRTDGILVSAGEPEDWKKAIIELHRDPRLRIEMGRQARMFVERYYDVKKSIASQAALYRKLVVQPEIQPKEERPEEVLYSI